MKRTFVRTVLSIYFHALLCNLMHLVSFRCLVFNSVSWPASCLDIIKQVLFTNNSIHYPTTIQNTKIHYLTVHNILILSEIKFMKYLKGTSAIPGNTQYFIVHSYLNNDLKKASEFGNLITLTKLIIFEALSRIHINFVTRQYNYPLLDSPVNEVSAPDS